MQYYYQGCNYYKKYPFQVFVHESTACGALHGQDFYELFITYSDNCVHYLNGAEEALPYGAVVLTGPSDVHRIGPADDRIFKYINLSFPKEVLGDLEGYLHTEGRIEAFFSETARKQVVLTESQTGKWTARIKRLARSKMTDSKLLELEMRSLLARIFTEIFLRTEEEPGNVPLWLSSLCSFIHEDMHFTWSLEELARHAGKTKEHVCRSMKKYLGVSPMDYINQVRVHYAASMLENSDVPITDIGMDVGFYSLSYFNKLFRENYGMSPREYRKMNRDSEEKQIM